MKCNNGYAGEHTICVKAKDSLAGLSSSSSGNNSKILPCEQVLHLLVLIAGTSDPVNADDGKTSRAVSKTHAVKDSSGKITNVLYWDKCFLDDIQELLDENINLKLFDFHGWTGDNRIQNREVAGAYLANRLCGAHGQTAFYGKTYQHREIHFHFVGHSHGGNVINEITKQIDKLGDKWPKKWKIKSLIYLSTPFFNKIHQVKVTNKIFHADAAVFHAYNKYDLTQRMLADFSMEPLAGAVTRAMKLTVGQKGEVDTELEKAIDRLVSSIQQIPFHHLTDLHFQWKMGWARVMSHAEGVELYETTIVALEDFRKLLIVIQKIIKALNKDYYYDIDRKIKDEDGNTISYKRKMISDPVYVEFERFFNILQADAKAIIKALQKTLNRQYEDFDKLQYIKDVFHGTDFLQHLVEFLDINAATLSSSHSLSLWSLLNQILHDNIEDYDNTYVDPAKQFAGTPLAGKITKKEMTKRDRYDGSLGSVRFNAFIKRIEAIEHAYEKVAKNTKPSPVLLDLLFTLVANEKMVYKHILANENTIPWGILETITWGDVDTLVKSLRHTFENLVTIIRTRHVGEMTQSYKWQGYSDDPSKVVGGTYYRGDIPYLLIESHSTSRRCMHKEIKQFIRKQTSC